MTRMTHAFEERADDIRPFCKRCGGKESDPVHVHRPVYRYCPNPDECCYEWGPLGIYCRVCGGGWPCETKRSHHTEAQNARIRRWAEGRAFRLAKKETL